ncbi:MAG TPA: hypothetical protein VMS64_09645 [Candidatus Methylomirabilis sp.]|nr:hypothetical protein [Candidatus Methylomirabilis sp.]
MSVRFWLRTLLLVALVAGSFLVQSAVAQDNPSGRVAPDSGSAAIKLDPLFLDFTAKDPGYSLSSPRQSTLWLPLAPSDWSLFKGVRPFATISPSTIESIRSDPGLTGALRDAPEDSWKGLGVGAGFQWRLSDRLDLFGQYQFMSLPGANAPTGSPLMRRDTEGPGVKAGFSIHF